MIMIRFKTKRDKEELLEKARKMEEYASMIVECIEDSGDMGEDYESYQERRYRMEHPDEMGSGRYGYRRSMR
jgi:hypothetical protein